MDIYYVDGNFVPANQAAISVNDLALLRGYGIFDFLRTYNGVPFYMDAHINRLRKSAEQIGLAIPWSHDQIRDIILETLRRNNHPESSIRLLVTGGDSPDGIFPVGNSRLIVMVSGIKVIPATWYESGVKITTTRIMRLFPEAKSINYIGGIRALEIARQQNAVESLYISAEKNILECTTSNFFGILSNRLITPKTGILPGITRKVIFDLVSDVFETDTRQISLEELSQFDEAFITSSSREVLPVIQIDDLMIGDGHPGKVTRKIMALFTDLTSQYGKGPLPE